MTDGTEVPPRQQERNTSSVSALLPPLLSHGRKHGRPRATSCEVLGMDEHFAPSRLLIMPSVGTSASSSSPSRSCSVLKPTEETSTSMRRSRYCAAPPPPRKRTNDAEAADQKAGEEQSVWG